MVKVKFDFPQTIRFWIEAEGQGVNLNDLMDERSDKSDIEISIIDHIGSQAESKYIKRETLDRIRAIRLKLLNG